MIWAQPSDPICLWQCFYFFFGDMDVAILFFGGMLEFYSNQLVPDPLPPPEKTWECCFCDLGLFKGNFFTSLPQPICSSFYAMSSISSKQSTIKNNARSTCVRWWASNIWKTHRAAGREMLRDDKERLKEFLRQRRTPIRSTLFQCIADQNISTWLATTC